MYPQSCICASSPSKLFNAKGSSGYGLLSVRLFDKAKGFDTLQFKVSNQSNLWCIAVCCWCRHFSHTPGWARKTNSFCFENVEQSRAKLCSNWKGGTWKCFWSKEVNIWCCHQRWSCVIHLMWGYENTGRIMLAKCWPVKLTMIMLLRGILLVFVIICLKKHQFFCIEFDCSLY